MIRARGAAVAIIATIAVIAVSMSFSCVSTASADGDEPATPSGDGAKPKTTKQSGKGTVETGKAVWYGGKWHGRKTASGEIYDKRSMTAAHKTLPFDTVVKVTNLRNEKSVTLRINNRGPYGKGRIIDVSEAAAEQLDMVDAGVVPCTIEVIELGKPKKKQKPAKPKK